jgi:hypothetical protein
MRIALVLLLVFCAAARAQEPGMNIGFGLVCDTPQQVEQFAAIYDGDADAALAAVNADLDDADACTIATFAFVLGPQVSVIKSAKGAFRVVQILVVGVFTDEGFESAMPQTCFTLAEVDEELGVTVMRGQMRSAP